MPKFEGALDRRSPDDRISEAQRKQAGELAAQYNTMFETMKQPFDDYFLRGKVKEGTGIAPDQIPRNRIRPSLDEMMKAFMREGGSMWIWAKMLYKTDNAVNVTEEALRMFYAACPPYRALLVAMCISQYERCLRDIRKGGRSLRAGRVDTYMASYLPYCTRFVTKDPKQFELLAEVVKYADLRETEVLSYSEFMKPLVM